MLSYSISYSLPQHHFIKVEFKCPVEKMELILIQLPAWRPGRYELGNFAKNVRNFSVKNENGKVLNYTKVNKDAWQVIPEKSKYVVVKYEYFAADLNAGSTYLDENLFYVNPVNCCVYCPDLIDAPLEISFQNTADFKIACAMTKKSKQVNSSYTTFTAKDFHELADSPYISGIHLQSKSYKVGSNNFQVWIQGDCKPEWDRIITDFTAFTSSQIDAYGEFPVKNYHFFIHALPINFYHGVEHQNSSVNVLGPAYELMNLRYVDLLGLCSHELYHAWNIKSIRPTELFPYDYTKENYFKTGYVAEGVTTYLGDYFLHASSVFSLNDFFAEMNMQMQKHMDNFGRQNYSVADSSFDTWLDGYVPGVPERKVSIYTEGCLTAFMTDVLILKHSGNKNSLHTVMKAMYENFYKKGKGYSEDDYWTLVEVFSGISFKSFRKKYIDGKESYLKELNECLNYLGFTLRDFDCNTSAENDYGIKITDSSQGCLVTSIHPDSPNYRIGLTLNDKIISINDKLVNQDANKWIAQYSKSKIKIQILRGAEIKNLFLQPSTKKTFRLWRWMQVEKSDAKQMQNYKRWLSGK